MFEEAILFDPALWAVADSWPLWGVCGNGVQNRGWQ